MIPYSLTLLPDYEININVEQYVRIDYERRKPSEQYEKMLKDLSETIAEWRDWRSHHHGTPTMERMLITYRWLISGSEMQAVANFINWADHRYTDYVVHMLNRDRQELPDKA